MLQRLKRLQHPSLWINRDDLRINNKRVYLFAIKEKRQHGEYIGVLARVRLRITREQMKPTTRTVMNLCPLSVVLVLGGEALPL